MMSEEDKKVLCDLEKKAFKDIKKLLEKPDISPTEWDAALKAVRVIEKSEKAVTSALTSMAMEEEYGPYEDHEESGRGRMNYRWGDQDNRESHWSYPTKANWHTQPNYNNRSSYSNSYSSGPDNTIANLRNLMNNANSESERMMYQRFIDEAEHMR